MAITGKISVPWPKFSGVKVQAPRYIFIYCYVSSKKNKVSNNVISAFFLQNIGKTNLALQLRIMDIQSKALAWAHYWGTYSCQVER